MSTVNNLEVLVHQEMMKWFNEDNWALRAEVLDALAWSTLGYPVPAVFLQMKLNVVDLVNCEIWMVSKTLKEHFKLYKGGFKFEVWGKNAGEVKKKFRKWIEDCPKKEMKKFDLVNAVMATRRLKMENTGTNTDTMDMKAVGVNTDAVDLNMEIEIPTEEEISVLPHPRVEHLKRQDSILSPRPQRRDSAESFGNYIFNNSFRFMGPDFMSKSAQNVPPVICESELDDVLTMDLHATSDCHFKRQRKKTIIDGIKDLECRDRVLEILGNRGIDCFTFKPKEEKKHMLYCYGVPTWITPEMIIETWTLNATPPKSVFRFKKKGANGQLYLTETVRIEVATEEEYLKILGYGMIMVIDDVYCRVSGPRPNRMAPFCRRCSQWGHSFHLCRKSPKCFKCLGKHDAKGCMVPVRSRKCANCNGSHFANYNGCPRAIRRKVPSTQKIPEGSQTTDGSQKQPAGHLQQRDLNNILSQLDLLRKNVLEISGSDMLQENTNGQMEHGNI